MADPSIDAIISGVGGNTRANFSGLASLPDAYWKGVEGRASDDFELDSLLGEIFADQAVQYARKIKNPAFFFF